MNQNIKWTRLLCALLSFLFLLSGTALAAEGDTAILRLDDPNFVDEISSCTASGDSFYAQGESALYVLRGGESEPTAYAWNVDLQALAGFSGDADKLIVAEGEKRYIFLHLYDGENNYVKTLRGDLVLADGKASAANLQEVAWPEELLDDGPVYIATRFAADGVLYMMVYGDSGYEVCAVNLETMAYAALPFERAAAIAPYVGNQVLGLSQDAQLTVYDPASESTTPLCKVDLSDAGNSIADMESPLSGLACDLESGACYCLCKGEVRPIDLKTGAMGAPITVLPMDGLDRGAFVLTGGWYVYCAYQATIVRSLNGGATEMRRLTIYDSSYEPAVTSACLDLLNLHGDVQASLTRNFDEMENLVQNLVNQDDRIDVYVVFSGNSQFSAAFQRGYMAELKSNALHEIVSKMYPGIRASVTREGELVALPVSASAWLMGVNKKALATIGLTEADIPSSWSEMLDFLIELPEHLAGTDVKPFGISMTQQDMRNQLFYMLFEDYSHYVNAAMDAPVYDTELLRGLLDKLAQVDFEALGLPKGDDDNAMSGMITYSFAGEADDNNLLEPSASATFGDFMTGVTPLVLSLDENTPPIYALDTAVAFINPFSKNIDLAMEYLECLAFNLSQEARYTLMPDLNEPVEGKLYQSELEERQKKVDELTSALESAEAVARPALEAQLQEAQEALEKYRVNGMAITQAEIDWFRANDDSITVAGENWLYSDGSGEAADLMQQYLDGRIDSAQLLSGIDKKVRMMAQEGK